MRVAFGGTTLGISNAGFDNEQSAIGGKWPGVARVCAGLVASVALLLLGSCATPDRTRPTRSPAEVRAQLNGLLPPKLADRDGWAADIQWAFQTIDVPPSSENLCAALAVIEQESSFDADPVVPGLAKIARTEIDRRAAKLKIPQFVVRAALGIDSAEGKSYAERLTTVRTEQQLSRLFEEFIDAVPLGQRLFGGANPVHTAGPMQVSIRFAQAHAGDHGGPFARSGSIRHSVFTRRGGLYFGIAHLLDYDNSYDRHLYRFADFNAGWYASRNAAFQAAVVRASGRPLALDGDLILPGSWLRDAPVGATEAAVRTLSDELELNADEIRRALEKSDRFEFEDTDLYQRVFALADSRNGKPLPRAVLPRITLDSPKITRKLTTEWFATRVQERYQRCIGKAFAT